jgi:hypothetical protein
MLSLLIAYFAFALANASIQDCNTTSVFRPMTLGLRPDPPVAGNLVYMTVEFNNPGPEVTEGVVSTSVTLNFIPFTPTVESLCENTACPLVTGFNDRSTQSTWPTDVKGKVVTKSVWSTLDGDTLLCVQTTFSVGETPRFRYTDVNNNSLVNSLFRDDISLKRIALRFPQTCPAFPDTTYYWPIGSYVNSSV